MASGFQTANKGTGGYRSDAQEDVTARYCESGKGSKYDIVATRHVVSFRGLVGLRKQATLMITVVAVVALTLILNVGIVQAAAMEILLQPSSVTQGMSVQASADEVPVGGPATLQVWGTSTCWAGTAALIVPIDAENGGYSVTFSTSSLAVGTHCVTDDYGDSPAILTVTAAPSPAPAPVGGVLMPANMLALIAPWVAVIGLVSCIGTAVVVAKKRER